MLKRIFILFFPIFLFTCNPAKHTIEELPLERIYCGSGGGFTGIETTFLLLENGQLFKRSDISKPFVPQENIQKKVAKDFFRRIENLKFYELELNEPGNMYHFIRCTKEGADHKVTWGWPENMEQKELLKLYDDMMMETQSKNKNPVK